MLLENSRKVLQCAHDPSINTCFRWGSGNLPFVLQHHIIRRALIQLAPLQFGKHVVLFTAFHERVLSCELTVTFNSVYTTLTLIVIVMLTITAHSYRTQYVRTEGKSTYQFGIFEMLLYMPIYLLVNAVFLYRIKRRDSSRDSFVLEAAHLERKSEVLVSMRYWACLEHVWAIPRFCMRISNSPFRNGGI